MSDIVICEFMGEAAVARLAGRFDTLYDPQLVDRPETLAEAVAACRALVVRNRTQLRGPLLEAASRLECVGRLGVGLDNIDTDACARRGIAVYPATGANDLAVAEYVIAAVLMLLRGAYHASEAVAAGRWPRQDLIGREASGKVLGLIGFGAIARQVAARASALGMRVTAFDPMLAPQDPAWAQAERRDLPALLAEADAVSLHVPLTPETRGMIDGGAIGAMKNDAVLINTARGGVVDEDALAGALLDGSLGGAALDVFGEEPLAGGAAVRLAGVPNLILTPHIGGVTRESNVRVSDLIADRITAHLEGSE